MTYLFDISVLVAGMRGEHIHHPSAVKWLKDAFASKIGFLISTHSLAETYSVLTRTPPPIQVSPEVARQLIHLFAEKAEVVSLDQSDYMSVIDECCALGFKGGATFDYLIKKAADKAEVDHILTLNARHFRRFFPAGSNKVVVP